MAGIFVLLSYQQPAILLMIIPQTLIVLGFVGLWRMRVWGLYVYLIGFALQSIVQSMYLTNPLFFGFIIPPSSGLDTSSLIFGYVFAAVTIIAGFVYKKRMR